MFPFTLMITFVMVYLFTAIIVNAFQEKAAQLKHYYKLRDETTAIPRVWFMYRYWDWLYFK